jgi:periplasmic protein TonB
MKKEKSAQQKIFEKRGMFLKIGYAISIGMVILAFQWKGKETKPDNQFKFEETTFFSQFDIRTKQKEPETKVIRKEEVIKKIEDINVIEVEKTKEIIDTDYQDPLDFKDMPAIKGEEGIIENDVINDSIHRNVEVPPEFIGGKEAMYKFLKDNLKFPKEEKMLGIAGTVKVLFVIDEYGSVTNIEIARSSTRNFDKEATRVIGLMPKWKPAMQQGHKVKVYYMIPIKFGINH